MKQILLERPKGIVVQWLEHCPVKAEVAGSSPVSPDILAITIPHFANERVVCLQPLKKQYKVLPIIPFFRGTLPRQFIK